MNLLLIAEESAGARLVRLLAPGPHRVVAVLTSPPEAGPGTVWNLARQVGFETWPARLVKDPAFADRLRTAEVDLILNAHSLYIIPAAVLEAARIGAFNLHPGPLPRYAGLNTVSWAIYRGETDYGVTLHWMEADIDTGHIAGQAQFPIEESDTALTLAARCVREGVPLALELLETAARDPAAIPRIPQDLGQREYFGKQVPNGGRLDWSRPAREIWNFLRACDYMPYASPWGHPKTSLDMDELAVVRGALTGRAAEATPAGTVGEAAADGVLVACADEWLLVREVLVNGRPASAAELLRAGQKLGWG